MRMTGGELISRIVTASGIETVFAVAGAAHTHLLDPLDRRGVTIVSSRHESGAVGAADGYARVRGGPGVALIVADQGLPNAIGGLAVAWHAGSPVVVLAACPPRHSVEADAEIDQDKLALVAPISKWARTVPAVERLLEYLLTGLQHALSGRPGPVVLLLPEQLLQAQVNVPDASDIRPVAAPAPAPEAIDAAATLLAAARRPMIIAGAGAAWSRAGDELRALVEDYSIPLLGNSLGRGQVAEDNARVFSWPYAQVAAHRADVVLLVGARLTQRLGLGLPPCFAADVRFIQIDIEPEALHRNRPAAIAIHADARRALAELRISLGERRREPYALDWLHAALERRQARITELTNNGGSSIHPLTLGSAIMQRLPEHAQLVGDGADIQTWMYGALRIRRPNGFLDHYPMGAMGSGTSLAVGAAAAHRETSGDAAPPTVLVTGDGSIGFHPAEIHAAVRANLRLLIIIGNDGAWGTEMHGQVESIGRAINTELGFLPCQKLGEAFGARGFTVSSPDELAPTLDTAFALSGVVVVNVAIDPAAGHELKINPDVRMIQFSDILDGRTALELTNDAGKP